MLADWLRLHLGLEIVRRDRADVSGEDSDGTLDAMQVLDQWNLLRNESESLQEVVTGHHAMIRTVAGTMRNVRVGVLQSEQAGSRSATVIERRIPEARPTLRFPVCIRAVLPLSEACHLGMDRKTVLRWLRQDGPPLWTKPARGRVIDPHRGYLDWRWSEGCCNATALARDLDSFGAGIKPLQGARSVGLPEQRHAGLLAPG